MTIKEQVAVSQEAREAADRLFEYAGFSFAADHLDMATDAVREAFARFERETLERAAKVAEAERYAQPIVDAAYSEGSRLPETYNDACDDIAQAIRSLIPESKG